MSPVQRKKKTEKTYQELHRRLEEREKELSCIYQLFDLTARPGESLKNIFGRAIYLLRRSFQDYQKTWVRLVIDNLEYKTKNYQPSSWKHVEPIKFKNKLIGQIEVGIEEEREKPTNDPFLKEEYQLVKFFAQKLSQAYEAKQAERAMMESENKFRSLALNLPGIVYRCALDENWTMYFISDYVEKVSGYPAADFIMNKKRTFASIIHPDDCGLVDETVQEGKKNRHPYSIDYRIVHKNGEVRYVHETGKAVYGKSRKEEWLDGVIFDITETVELRERLFQAQKMTAFSHLVGGVAHNLMHLLKLVDGYCQISSEYSPTNDPLSVGLSEIKRSAIEAEMLMQQLIAFTQRDQPNPQKIDINRFISDSLGQLEKMIGTHIKLVLEPAADLNEIRLDPEQLQTLVTHLVQNAAEAIKKSGTITINIANAQLDDTYFELPSGVNPGDYVMLSVADNGMGIDIRDQSHIFEPFYTTKDSKTHVGLGLTTVFGIVKEYDGHIMFESETGLGSTFKVYLPAVKSNN